MALPLLVFPSTWGGSVKCDKDQFIAPKVTLVCANTRKLMWVNGCQQYCPCTNNDDDSGPFCACHSYCSGCCGAARTNPKMRDVPNPLWPVLIEPYINVSVTCQWSEQVMGDCGLKLNGLDPKHGIGLFHGLLLLDGTDDDDLCSKFAELGVDTEKRYVNFDSSLLTTMSSFGIKEELYGGTALHFAASLGRRKCVEVLLHAGGDVTAKTASGKTPLEITEDVQIKEILESAVSTGPKSLAQLAKEGKNYAVRHRIRTGKVTPNDLAQQFEGKTAMEWIWASMCEWRFAMKLDEDSLAAFKLMSEMKYRYGWDSLKNFGEPPKESKPDATDAEEKLYLQAGDQTVTYVNSSILLRNQEEMMESLSVITRDIQGLQQLMDDVY